MMRVRGECVDGGGVLMPKAFIYVRLSFHSELGSFPAPLFKIPSFMFVLRVITANR